jgi:hypothetical protein
VRSQIIFAAALGAALGIKGQTIENGGSLAVTSRYFPRTPIGDSSTAVAEALLRVESTYRPQPWLKLASVLDARTDTHRLTQRTAALSWRDRTTQRPAFAVRTLSATISRDNWNVEVGKQIIRWGAADGVNPLDRFAPRDFVNLVDNEVLPVFGVRASAAFAAGTRELELVAVPWMTPSRLPLARTRWMPLPPDLPSYPEIREARTRYPGGAELGVRWRQSRGSWEYSLAFFNGHNYSPTLRFISLAVQPLIVEVRRYFPGLRMYGGSLLYAGSPVTIRAEGGYFQSGQAGPAPGDDYAFYVAQAEKQRGRWSLSVGYTAQQVFHARGSYLFDPDRALTGAFLGRASYQIDARSTFQFRGGAHRQGIGTLLQGEYSRSVGANWRTSFGLTWIHGSPEHLFGQFGKNSYGSMTNALNF